MSSEIYPKGTKVELIAPAAFDACDGWVIVAPKGAVGEILGYGTFSANRDAVVAPYIKFYNAGSDVSVNSVLGREGVEFKVIK